MSRRPGPPPISAPRVGFFWPRGACSCAAFSASMEASLATGPVRGRGIRAASTKRPAPSAATRNRAAKLSAGAALADERCLAIEWAMGPATMSAWRSWDAPLKRRRRSSGKHRGRAPAPPPCNQNRAAHSNPLFRRSLQGRQHESQCSVERGFGARSAAAASDSPLGEHRRSSPPPRITLTLGLLSTLAPEGPRGILERAVARGLSRPRAMRPTSRPSASARRTILPPPGAHAPRYNLVSKAAVGELAVMRVWIAAMLGVDGFASRRRMRSGGRPPATGAAHGRCR